MFGLEGRVRDGIDPKRMEPDLPVLPPPRPPASQLRMLPLGACAVADVPSFGDALGSTSQRSHGTGLWTHCGPGS